MEGATNNDEYSQFNYLTSFGDSALRNLASEQLLKEIGVDI